MPLAVGAATPAGTLLAAEVAQSPGNRRRSRGGDEELGTQGPGERGLDNALGQGPALFLVDLEDGRQGIAGIVDGLIDGAALGDELGRAGLVTT